MNVKSHLQLCLRTNEYLKFRFVYAMNETNDLFLLLFPFLSCILKIYKFVKLTNLQAYPQLLE